ncbi:hypothetical protein HaLaN_10260, partial [Haematococcus lacustris]
MSTAGTREGVYEAQLHTSHVSFEKMTEAHNFLLECQLTRNGKRADAHTAKR